jgi:hypothetical protein
MKTAAEFLDQGNFNNTTDMMIEFAKMHVEAALKAASENAECYESMEGMYEVRTRTILNAYPDSNIK